MQKSSDYLFEKDKITELINNLFIFTDKCDWNNVQNCFAEKVHFDMTSMGPTQLDKMIAFNNHTGRCFSCLGKGANISFGHGGPGSCHRDGRIGAGPPPT